MSNIIIGAIVFIVLFIIAYVKISMDEKAGENSEEKQKIEEIVKTVLPDGETYMACYGTREDFSLGGGGRTITTTTKYWYYAIGFKPNNLYLIPLSFEDGEISYDEPMHFTKENIGKIEVKKSRIVLFDKDEKEMFTLFVVESNTKDDKYHPVNIQQKEECDAFFEFAKTFME